MTIRINPYELAPETMAIMPALRKAVEASHLPSTLRLLVEIRVSQLNGCAFCLHLHVKEAQEQGVPQMKLHLLNAWRESSFFDRREQAALEWAEALTCLWRGGAPDAAYEELAREFTPQEQVELTMVIGAMNLMNRFGVGFRYRHPGGGAS